MREDGGTVMGVDWRISLQDAWNLIGPSLAIQGNLDPGVLLGPWKVIRKQAIAVLRQAARQDRPYLQPRTRHTPGDAT